MGTREQLYTALRNADAAGDTEAAKKLAAYIQSLPSESIAQPPAPPEGILSSFGRGIASYGPQLQETLGGLQALTGKALAETVAPQTGASLIKSGVERMQEAEKKTQAATRSGEASFTEALDKGVGTVLTEWLPYQVGSGAANLLETLGVMGAGALVGSAAPGIGTAAGAVTGAVQKELVKRGVQEAAKKIAREMGEEASKKFVEKETLAITKDVARKYGMGAALAGQAAGYGFGQTASRAVEAAIERGESPEDIDLARVIPAGMVSTVAEFVSDKLAFGALKGLKKEVKDAVEDTTRTVLQKAVRTAGDMGKGVLITGTKEAPTEIIQSLAERFGAKLSLSDQKAIDEYINAVAASYAMSVVPGAIGGIKTKPVEEEKAAEVPAEKPLALEYKPDTLVVFPDGSVGKRGDVENYINSLPEDQRIQARARLLGMGEKPATPIKEGAPLTEDEIFQLDQQLMVGAPRPRAEDVLGQVRGAIQTAPATTPEDVARIRDEHETAVINSLLEQDRKMQAVSDLARLNVERASQAESMEAATQDADRRVREGRLLGRVQALIDQNIPFASTAIADINRKFEMIGEAPLDDTERSRVQNIMTMAQGFTDFVKLPSLSVREQDIFAENQAMEDLIKEKRQTPLGPAIPAEGSRLLAREKAEIEAQQPPKPARPTAEDLLTEIRGKIQAAPPATSADIARFKDEHETAVINALLENDKRMAAPAALAKANLERLSQEESMTAAVRDASNKVREGRLLGRVQSLIDQNIQFGSTAISDINRKFEMIGEAPLDSSERQRIQSIMAMARAFMNFANLPELPVSEQDVFAENQAMEALIKERKSRGQVPSQPVRAEAPAPSQGIQEAPVSAGIEEGRTVRPEGGIEPGVTEDRQRVEPVAPAAPVVEPTQQAAAPSSAPAKAPQGSQTRIITPDGNKIPAEWKVVEADSISASMVEGKSQPRDRQRAASNAQVAEIAQNPDFDRLSDTSQTMDYGAPTLTQDDLIVGGNGRFEGVSRSYDSEAGQRYKQSLLENAERLGLDPEQIGAMRKPILVRKITQAADTRKLAIQSNIVAGLKLSDMEQAALDAERMGGLDRLAISDTGDIPLTAGNIEAIRDSLRDYTTEEMADMMAADGGLSQTGLRRVKNAILYKAYGKTDTLARLIESPDPDLKNIGTALMRASGNMSRMMDAIRSGAIPAEYNIIEDLTGAIETLSALRSSGTKVEEFLGQSELFGDGISGPARSILKFMDSNLRSAKNITEYLNNYAQVVLSAESATGGLFGEVKLPAKQETLERAAEKYEAQRKAAKSQQSIFEQPAGEVREEGGAKPEGAGRAAGSDEKARVEGKKYSAGKISAGDISDIDREIRKQFGESGNMLLEAGRIKIVEKVSDLPDGPHPENVRGMYYRGMNYVVADNVAPNEVRGLILHEVGVHAGLRQMIGDPLYKKILNEVEAKVKTDMIFAKARNMAAERANLPEQIPEETLAYLVENMPELPLVKRILAAIRQWLYRVTGGRIISLTDADLQAMALASLRDYAKNVEAEGREGPFYHTAYSRGPKLEQIARKVEAKVKPPKDRIEIESFGHIKDKALMAEIQRRFNPKPETIVDRINSMRENFWERMAQGIVDKYRAIKKYSDEGYMLARMSNTVDGAVEGLLFHGQVFNDGGALNIKPKTEGLYEAFKPLGKELDNFLIWMAMSRDANLPEEKRSFSAAALAARDELIDGSVGGRPRKEVYNEVRLKMNALNKSVLNVAKEAGIIDKTGYERFISDLFYVPLYKVSDDGELVPVSGEKLTDQFFSKELKGNKDLAFNDLMQNIVQNWSHILSASMKNIAATKVMEDAEKFDAVRPSLKAQYEYEDGVVYKVSKKGREEIGELRPEYTTKKTGTVKVIKDGMPVYYEVDDPLLLDSIAGITWLGPQGKWLDVAKNFKNMLQFGVTISPAFRVRNLIRDAVSAISIADIKKNPVMNAIEGMNFYSPKDPNYIGALAGGGMMKFGAAMEGGMSENIKRLVKAGVPDNTILDSPEKIKNGLKYLYDKYEEWGNKMENANRLAIYQQAREKGMSHLEASFHAKDLMDFTLHGSFPAFRRLTMVIPFLNARVQGLYKLGRDGITPTYRLIHSSLTGKEISESDKKKGERFAIVASAVGLASAALYLAFKDDEEFKKREQWDRDNFWWIKFPGMEYAFRLPKPFELGAFGTLVERSLEQIVDQGAEGKVFGEAMTRMLSDTFAINPIPQMFKPVLDIYANKDSFTGAPIETAGMEKLSKQERVADNTSWIGKGLGGVSKAIATVTTEKAELSPVQVEYLIKGYLGWLGAMATSTAHYAAMPFSQGAYPDMKYEDTFSMGFVKELPATQSKFVTSFYDNNQKIQQAMADMRHYASLGEVDKAQKIAIEQGDKIKLAKFYDQASDDMAKMRKYIKIVTADAKMTGAEKREQIDRAKLIIAEIARQAEELRVAMKE